MNHALEIKNEIQAAIKKFENEERAQREQIYFKNSLKKIYGAGAKNVQNALRRFEKSLMSEAPETIYEVCDLLLKTEVFELQQASSKLLYSLRNKFSKVELFQFVYNWIDIGLIANWATIDDTSTSTLGDIVSEDDALAAEIIKWASSNVMWVRRASAVAFIKPARYGRRLDTAYEIATILRHDKEDYINKAIGWLLREAGKTDEGRLQKFLEKNGREFSRTTVRYAIEKFEEGKRKHLLEITRAE